MLEGQSLAHEHGCQPAYQTSDGSHHGKAHGPTSTMENAVFEFDELVSILLRDVGKTLLNIYQLYFEHELKCSDV